MTFCVARSNREAGRERAGRAALDLQDGITCIGCSRKLRLRGWSVLAVAQGCRSLEKAQLLELTCAESCLSSVGRRRRLAVSASTLRDCSLSSSSRSFLFLSFVYNTLLFLFLTCLAALLQHPLHSIETLQYPRVYLSHSLLPHIFHLRDYVTSLRST